VREFLTIIACLLVALLTAALAGPWLVDWTSQRAMIEARLSQALGAQVKTRGAIDLKLLPTPRLVLGGVEVGGRDGAPLLRSGEARFELAVTPLLRGELNFLEASLESPQLRIDPTARAGTVIPVGGRLPEEVRFERIRIHNGSVTLARNTGDVTMSGIDIDAEADSLAGPFKGSGTVRRGEGAIPFRFATGPRDGRRMRLKLVVDEAQGLPRIEFDGAAQVPDAGVAAASFEGQSVLSGMAPLGWRAAGPVRIDAAGASSEGLDLRIGAEDGGLAFTLSGSVAAAAPHADLTLAARQLDLDRFSQGQGADAQTAFDFLTTALDDRAVLSRLPMPINLSLQAPTVQVGGDALTEVGLTLGLTPGQPVSLTLQASAPGRSQAHLAGFVETGAAARYSGEVEASVRDVSRLADWLRGLAPDLSERVRAVPFRLIDVKGRARVSAAGVSADGLTLKIDRSSMTGALAYTRAVGGDRARLFADLEADALDLDGVPDLSGPGQALAETDVQIALNARAVRLARVGQGMIDAGRIRLRLQKTPDELRIEDLSVAELGGANVSASGDVRSDKARLDVRVNAQRLGELAALLRRVAPGPWAEALATRATALSPARLTIHFGAERPNPGDDYKVTDLRIDGSVRDTKVNGRATPQGDVVGLQMTVDGAEAPLVLRQIGFETVPLSGSGRAHFAVTGSGSLAKGFDASLAANVAGTDLSFAGRVSGDMAAPTLQGTVRLRSEDASRLLRVMTVALPDVTQSLPLDVQAQVSKTSADVEFTQLAGGMAGARLAGNLALRRERSPRVEGNLEIDRASLPGLVSLLLGPPQAVRLGARWSTSAFAPGLQDPLPVTLAVKAQDLQLPNGLGAQGASFTLRLAPGLLAFDQFNARLDQGGLSGGLVLRRDGGAASLSGSLKVSDVPVDRAGISGRLNGAVTFTSTGANAAALAGGLAGTGAARIANFRFSRADPAAPGRVIVQTDEGSIFVSENDFMGALRRELDRGPLDLGDQSFDVSMAAGVLRLASAAGQNLSLDLRTLAVEARSLLTADPLPKDWSGPAPQVTVIDRDGQRDLDAGAFINALAARAITREAARIEALEADIRERAAFARRKRGLDFLHQREREVAAFEEEQARLEQEAAKRAEEERRRVAEDERRRLQQLSAPAPINIVPPAPVPSPVIRMPPATRDPSAAGRY
jgi:uncharacterized protein involved in outer membrane biogenesis